MDRHNLLTLAALVSLTVLAGCLSGSSQPYGNTGAGNQQPTDGGGNTGAPAIEKVSGVSPDRTITLTNYKFSATSPQISAGTVVKFVSQQGTHTVTLDSAGIDVTLSSGQSVMLRFNEAGTYQVYCSFHGSPGSGMHSTVQVS
ncbi:MAG: plastocyanin/azurin family copper-binding protein [Candidatus Nanohaloarchaea archaeon]|nr:plastocyanin/azurin family copper-binding protein [Candidatus Nanohaloarchaea archaeon]